MFGIYNKYNILQEQFGTFDNHTDAYRVLRKAIEKCPDMNLHINPIENKTEKEK